jgi:hypothetical protein
MSSLSPAHCVSPEANQSVQAQEKKCIKYQPAVCDLFIHRCVESCGSSSTPPN